jgi:hypothetical protein
VPNRQRRLGTLPGVDEPEEVVLHGGITNAGAVVRVGDHVLRSSNPFSTSVHTFLRAVDGAGFDGASTPVGIDPDGRERLVYIEGEAARVPYPVWAQTTEVLTSAVELLAGLHRASATYDPAALDWNVELADPAGGPVVCHNDVCLDNVIVRDGRAVGLIDFDFASPGRPAYDLAQLARHLVPILGDDMSDLLGWVPADRPARLRLVADTYGLDADGRSELLGLIPVAMARARSFIEGRVAAGDLNFQLMYDYTGGAKRFDDQDDWWTDHRESFVTALR